jgi:ribulose 1,5-bisphosphate synthetase/thiazole synthase
MAANEKVDVVVVGAGASGSVYAAVMAKCPILSRIGCIMGRLVS